jgi:VWFA-related protein
MYGRGLGAVVGALAIAGSLAMVHAQQGPTFRSSINLVEVDALAVGPGGEVIGDIRQDEFEILEDGRPQRIASFQFVHIPLPAAGERALSRREGDDVFGNDDRAGRLLVLVLDDLHIAPFRAAAVRSLANQFIGRMGASDLMAIVSTSGDRRSSQEFTKDRAALENAVAKFTPSKDAPTFNADASSAFAAQKGVAMLKTLGDVAGHLAGVQHRRKTVLFLSEGADVAMLPDLDDPNAIAANALSNSTSRDAAKGSSTPEDRAILERTALEDLLRRAQRANVAIYPIDPRGIEDASPTDANDFLRTIASNTGGRAIVATNRTAQGLDLIIRESSSYYLIGYESSTPADGRFHRLSVRVRRPDVDVRARQGFVAPDAKKLAKAKPPAAIDEALSAPAQNSGFAIRGTAAAFPSPTGHGAVVAVAAEISGAVLARAAGSGDPPGVEFAVVAVDKDGRTRAADRERVKINAIKPGAESWIRIVSRLDVKSAGHYQIRLAAQASGSDAASSVFYDVDVPDFDGTPVVMSGIVVGPPNRGGGSARIAKMREVASVIPVATRTFSRSDLVSAFTSIRTTKQAFREPVDVTTAIYRSAGGGENGAEVFRRTDRKETANAERGADHVFPMPLDTLEPGEYLLRVTAASAAKNVAPVSRETRFAVR